ERTPPSATSKRSRTEASRPAAVQNRSRRLPTLLCVTQKLTPSLQAPSGPLNCPAPNDPRGVRSAAFQSETLSPALFVTRIRWPSNAAPSGAANPLPVRVASSAPPEARTIETELEARFGTQIFVPSNTGIQGEEPTVTVCRMAPAPSSFKRVPAISSVAHTFAPS